MGISWGAEVEREKNLVISLICKLIAGGKHLPSLLIYTFPSFFSVGQPTSHKRLSNCVYLMLRCDWFFVSEADVASVSAKVENPLS